MKTFYITYFSNKDGKMITRRGKEDEKTRLGLNQKTQIPYFVYYDEDAYGYRTASGNWTMRSRVA